MISYRGRHTERQDNSEEENSESISGRKASTLLDNFTFFGRFCPVFRRLSFVSFRLEDSNDDVETQKAIASIRYKYL